jgi:hypothetical protein
MCIVISAVVIALYRAIRVVCLHDVCMIVIGVEGADQGEEEPSHHHMAPGMSLPHEPSHHILGYYILKQMKIDAMCQYSQNKMMKHDGVVMSWTEMR